MKLEIGSGALVLLTCILVICKVAGWLTIPWLWVFCPIWIPVALLGITLLFILFLYIIGVLISFIR